MFYHFLIYFYGVITIPTIKALAKALKEVDD